jgi:hypothetical protein
MFGSLKANAQSCAALFRNADKVDSAAIVQLRGLKSGLERELRTLEVKAERAENLDRASFEPSDEFNAKSGQPPVARVAKDVELVTELDGDVHAVSYGIPGLGYNDSTRLHVLGRITGVVEDLAKVEKKIESGKTWKDKDQYAKVYTGRAEIRAFLKAQAKQFKSAVHRNAEVERGEAQDESDSDEPSFTESLVNRLPDRVGRVPVPKALLVELSGIWTAGFLLAPSVDGSINEFLRANFGFEMPYPSQIGASLVAVAKHSYNAVLNRRLKSSDPLPKAEEAVVQAPETAIDEAVRKAPKFTSPYARMMRQLNYVSLGRQKLNPNELWYFGTSYFKRAHEDFDADEDAGADADFHYDLIFYRDRQSGEPTLLVFNRPV